MNLQENIERLHKIMGGVLSENRMDTIIKDMINNVGLEGASKMVGGYDEIKSYLSNEDKIDYIKEKVNKLNNGVGIFLDIFGGPIKIKEEDGEIHQIQWLGPTHVRVIQYLSNNRSEGRTIRPSYEDLLPQDLDELIKRLLKM